MINLGFTVINYIFTKSKFDLLVTNSIFSAMIFIFPMTKFSFMVTKFIFALSN